MKKGKKMKNWEIKEEKTVYLVQCFIPKASNVVNSKSHWVTCHRIKHFEKAETAFERRLATQPMDKWRMVKSTVVTKTSNKVLAYT